jgi:hypothetical protein
MKSAAFVALLVLSSAVVAEEDKNNNNPQPSTSPSLDVSAWALPKAFSSPASDDFNAAPARTGSVVVLDEPTDTFSNFRNTLRKGWNGVGLDKAPGGGVMVTYTKEW